MNELNGNNNRKWNTSPNYYDYFLTFFVTNFHISFIFCDVLLEAWHNSRSNHYNKTQLNANCIYNEKIHKHKQ